MCVCVCVRGRGGRLGPIFCETWYNHYAGEGLPTLLPCCSVSSSAAVIEKTCRQMTLLKREVMMSYLCDLHGRNSLLV